MKDNFFNLIFISIIIIAMLWYHDNYILPFRIKKYKIKKKVINKHIDIEERNKVYQESSKNMKDNIDVKESFSEGDLGSLLNSDSFSLGKLDSNNNNVNIDDNSLFNDNHNDNQSFDSKFSDDF